MVWLGLCPMVMVAVMVAVVVGVMVRARIGMGTGIGLVRMVLNSTHKPLQKHI